MACTIKYKGITFTEAEFDLYIQSNMAEFAGLLPTELGSEMNSSKYSQPLQKTLPETTSTMMEVAKSISDRVSDEVREKIAAQYGPSLSEIEFIGALAREITDSIFNKKNDEIAKLAIGEFLGAFSNMTDTEIANLQGLERNLYNTTTGQKTNYESYPTTKESEIAFSNEDGEWVVYDKQELITKIKEGTMSAEEVFGLPSFLASDMIFNDKAQSNDLPYVDYGKILSEQDKAGLTKKLLGVLEKLGFSTMKMSEYIKTHKTRTGVDPSVEAIADMVNRIVAISSGENTEELLSEEVAHVLTETYNNQDEIRALLPEVEFTETWKDHADAYTRLYEGKGLTGEQLTEKVRREILGKLIADKISLNEQMEPSSFLGQVQEVVGKFFNRVASFLKPSIKNNLDALTSRIAESINEEAKIEEMYSTSNLENNPFSEFYSADIDSALTTQLGNLVKDSRKLLAKNKRGSLASKVDTLATMAASNTLTNYTSLQAVAQYLDITNSVKRNVMTKVKKFDEAVKAGKTPKSFINSIDGASINILMTENLPHLQKLSATVKELEGNNYFSEQEMKEFAALKKKVSAQIDSMILDINSLKGEVTLKDTISGVALMEDMIVEYRISPEAATEIKEYLDSTTRDISTLQMFFGNLQNAPNPILALLGRLIGDIHHKTDVATKHFSRKFTDKMISLGISQGNYQKFFDKVIQKGGDNKITGYLKGVIDWGRFETAKRENELAAYNTANKVHIDLYNAKSANYKLTYTPITDKEEIGTKPEAPRISEFTGEAKKEYNRVIDEWREENLEQPYTQSFRQARKDMFDSITNDGITLPDGTVVKEIPDSVPEMMQGWASNRREIKAQYIKNGVLDYSEMSEVERVELEVIKRERLESKSLVDPVTGLDRTGDELKIALALQAIEQYYVQKNIDNDGKRIIKAEFIDKLAGFTDPQEAFEWFSRNSGVSFNNNFWKRMDTVAETSGDKFRSAVASSDIPQTEKDYTLEKIAELERLLKRRTQFLKQFKNTTTPAEVDTSIMEKDARDIYIEMENNVEMLFTELNTTLKDNTGTTVQDNLTTESTANEGFKEDFDAYMKDNPNGNVVKFAKQNATEKGERAINMFNEAIKGFERSGNVNHSKVFRRDISKMLGLAEGADTAEITRAMNKYKDDKGSFEPLLEDYVKTKVVGYYKRFAPAGFTSFYEQLKTGQVTDLQGNTYNLAEMVEMMRDGTGKGKFQNDILNYLDLNPEVEWMEDESSLEKNDNFIENKENESTNYGGYGQPVFDKYKNQEFINEYNISEHLYKTTGETKSQGTTAEKQKEVDFLEFLVHSRYDNYNQQGVAGIANAYSLPGVRQASVDKTKSFAKNPVSATKEWYKDFIQNSVDKKIYGESASGEIDNDPTNIDRLVVPLLNVQPLERLEDTTTDLIYSYTVHTYNANLYNHRQEAMTKANQLETLLLSRDFKDKAVKDSNTHQAFKDFKKAYLLGVQETKRIKVGVGNRKFDMTNILRTFDQALGTINVGLNPAISITAATSAATFSITEALAGQYMDVASYKKGIARFHSKAGAFVGQTGEIDKTNEVYLFGERFGLFNILNGVENSSSGRFTRELFKDGLSGMAHIMTEFSTKPFAPSIMYATLDNFRYVESKNEETGEISREIMSHTQFIDSYKGSKTDAEIKALWKTYEKNSVLNNMSVENGMVKYSDRFQNEFWKDMNEEEKATFINSMELDIKNTVSTIISRVDAKMPMYDKSVASRNALARFLLRHREWFTINFQNRFKRGHNNLYTGQSEVGHYVTLSKYLGKTIQAFNPKNDDAKLREIFDEMTPSEKMNMKRVLIDTAISAILVAMGSLVVSPWGDDKENKDNWKVQFLAYMYYRLSSEQMTSGVAGIPSYKDMLESPFVAVNSLKEIMKPSNYSSDAIERGPYEGHSKIFRLAAKNTFARHYYDLVHGLQQKSDFYRLNNEWTLWGMQKTSKKEQEEQEKYEKELQESYTKGSERFMR